MLMLIIAPCLISARTYGTSDWSGPTFLCQILFSGPKAAWLPFEEGCRCQELTWHSRPLKLESLRLWLMELAPKCPLDAIALECVFMLTPQQDSPPAACPFVGTFPLLLIFLSTVASSLPPEPVTGACWAAFELGRTVTMVVWPIETLKFLL